MALSILLFGLAASATLTIAIPGRVPTGVFECGSFLLLMAQLWHRRGEPVRWNLTCVALTGIPLIGLVQLSAGTSASPWNTANSVLQWSAVAALAWVAAQVLSDRGARLRFLEWLGAFAALLAIACLSQPALGIDYDRFAGPFQNRNTYCSFVELTLPVTVWLASRGGQKQLGWWAVAAAQTASVLVTGSRAGAVLTLAEFLILLVAVSGRRQVILASLAVVASLAAIAGLDKLSWRMRLGDPLSHRREFYQAGVEMVASQPGTGVGLGAFADTYPRYAAADFGRTVNHVHNDWLEWGIEGGLSMPLLVLCALVPLFSSMRRHWWAAGVFAVALHAMADYPFARSGLGVWVWILSSAAVKQPFHGRLPVRRRESGTLLNRSFATARR